MTEDFCAWEQQADEDYKAWAAFVEFRDSGCQRTLMDAANKLGCSKNSITKWSRAYNWEARVRAWDAEVDRVRRERFLAEQRRLIREHATLAGWVREKAVAAIKLIVEANPSLDDDSDKALRLLKFATELEAKSCGLPTEVTALSLQGGHAKPTEDIYFDSLPDDQLAELVERSMAALKRDKGAHAAADTTECNGDGSGANSGTGAATEQCTLQPGES